jgi:uncharacterized integral membrane protein
MFKFFVYFIVLIVTLIFGFNNSEVIGFVLVPKFLEFEAPLYVVIFLSFILGILLSYIYFMYRFVGFKFRDFFKERKIAKLEKNVKKSETREVVER